MTRKKVHFLLCTRFFSSFFQYIAIFSLFTSTAGFHEEETEHETVKVLSAVLWAALCPARRPPGITEEWRESRIWGHQGVFAQGSNWHFCFVQKGRSPWVTAPWRCGLRRICLPREWRCLCGHLGKERWPVAACPGSAPSRWSHHTWCPKSQKFGTFVFYTMLTSFWILGQIF